MSTTAGVPRELFYLLPLGPIVTAPLLHPHFFEEPAHEMLRHVAGDAIRFATIPVAIHLAYRYVLSARIGPPSLVDSVERRART